MIGRFLLIGSVLMMFVAGCGDYEDGYYRYGANEIVFGIRQRIDPASGESSVTASYEFLGLADKGGWATSVFRDGDGDGTCYFERYDNRLGQPHVESGVATWVGGKLPAAGLQVLANQPEPTQLAGAGWATDDLLSFDVSGFAMPRLQTVTMKAPRTELEITAISPALAEGATETSLAPTNDVGVTWTPTSRDGWTRVMVTLETDEEGNPGGGVRCFGSSTSGSVVIPAKWVARLFSSVDPAKPIKGRISVASHRQITYLARGSWTAYIVATTLHREQPFTGSR
ncbi:MAG: hypothetical protein BGO98_33655 [Myxococcales bacterium 68-20]|nr:hypothetical protein [Myxococcales bacterium]OJY22973.1 MAG: hypothetical protein BGO98_33655 [Myxococcales bacterium 68-20]